MENCDAMVIGAGILGCFAARSLTRYDISVCLVEQRKDVCAGITKANTAIVYSGYDPKPGTLKARLCTNANRTFGDLCRELDVRFSRCGSLLVCFGPNGEQLIRNKYQQGLESGVEGLELLGASEIAGLEPRLCSRVRMGLFAPSTGTVNPWELGLAACENAVRNGARLYTGTKVLGIKKEHGRFIVETDRGEFRAKCLVNCGGISASAIREMYYPPHIRLRPKAGDYLIFDSCVAGTVNHIIFYEPENGSKGLTLVPTVDGNLMAGPSAQPADDWLPRNTEAGMEHLYRLCAELVPSLSTEYVIRRFGTVRPKSYFVEYRNGGYVDSGRRIHGFSLLEEQGLFSLIGIKTPGMTCANALGELVADRAAKYMQARRNPHFDPFRAAPPRIAELSGEERRRLIAQNKDYGKIVCRCRGVSEGEVLDAIAAGAVSIGGVKRRTGATMGRCQGGFCTRRIAQLLSETLGVSVGEILEDGYG